MAICTVVKVDLSLRYALIAVGLLTRNVLHCTIPHELCGCGVKDVHGLQSFVSTHSGKKGQFAFHPLFATANAFNICFFETEFSHFFRGMGLGLETVHHCHREVQSSATKKNNKQNHRSVSCLQSFQPLRSGRILIR